MQYGSSLQATGATCFMNGVVTKMISGITVEVNGMPRRRPIRDLQNAALVEGTPGKVEGSETSSDDKNLLMNVMPHHETDSDSEDQGMPSLDWPLPR